MFSKELQKNITYLIVEAHAWILKTVAALIFQIQFIFLNILALSYGLTWYLFELYIFLKFSQFLLNHDLEYLFPISFLRGINFMQISCRRPHHRALAHVEKNSVVTAAVTEFP